MATPPDQTTASDQPLETTKDLLSQARQGDLLALERLLHTFRPLLTHWAHGRLPTPARGLSDTDDLVQITFIRVLEKLEGFEVRRPGAFLAYLRSSLMNNLRNEIRHASRRPRGEALEDELIDAGRSPLELAVGRRALDAYEEALAGLSEEQQTAVMLRLEMGCTFATIAEMLDKPTANSARMLVNRAVARLAESIDKDAIRDVQW